MPNTEILKQRLKSLEEDLINGKKEIDGLEVRMNEIKQTCQRYEGAIAVIRELLEESETNKEGN